MYMASPVRSSRIFARHLRVFALRRARPRAGRRIEISSAMMPITTSNSTSVNACRLKCRTSCLAEADALIEVFDRLHHFVGAGPFVAGAMIVDRGAQVELFNVLVQKRKRIFGRAAHDRRDSGIARVFECLAD